MSSATLSSKFQILVPKDVRETLKLQPGQKFDFIVVGNALQVVPQVHMRELFGSFAHITEPFLRDRSDLDDDPELRAQVEARLHAVAQRRATKQKKQ